MNNLYSLALGFLDRFPVTHFITKATPIIIINSVSVKLLLKTIRICSTGRTGFIHMNALEARHMHTNITDISTEFQESSHRPLTYACLV